MNRLHWGITTEWGSLDLFKVPCSNPTPTWGLPRFTRLLFSNNCNNALHWQHWIVVFPPTITFSSNEILSWGGWEWIKRLFKFLLLHYSYSVGVGRKECRLDLRLLGASWNHCCVCRLFCKAQGSNLTPVWMQRNSAGLAGNLVGGKVAPSRCAG